MLRLRTVLLCLAMPGLVLVSGCEKIPALGSKNGQAVMADRIYTGGTILTMNDDQPVAEALAVKDGKILAVGSLADVMQKKSAGTQVINLEGKALLPGFVDAHSHFMQAVQASSWVNVSSPPVGNVVDIPSLVLALQAQAVKSRIKPDDWLVAWGYDPDGLAEKRQLTRDDLDAAFPDRPVMVIHVSGHGAVLNGAALKVAGITADTPTPAGGVIARKPGSQEPAGLVMETAFLPVMDALPKLSASALQAAIRDAQNLYASNGYTTINEGATGYRDYTILRDAAQAGQLFLDVVALPVVFDLKAYTDNGVDLANTAYDHRLKIGGVKLLADGSPQAKTAYWSLPLLTNGPNGERSWRGEPMLPYDEFEAQVRDVIKRGARVVVHANGDAAIDMVLKAMEANNINASMDRRDEVIHSQFMRPDQVEKYQALGLTPSLFTNHIYYWGDVHVANVGLSRASFISPMRAFQALGMPISNHTDYLVTPLDPMMTVWTAVNRVTRSGEVLGAGQRVDANIALKAITAYPAWQYHEEASKGTLEVGKLADLVILDRDPLQADPKALRDIRVLETIKEGETVYRR